MVASCRGLAPGHAPRNATPATPHPAGHPTLREEAARDRGMTLKTGEALVAGRPPRVVARRLVSRPLIFGHCLRRKSAFPRRALGETPRSCAPKGARFQTPRDRGGDLVAGRAPRVVARQQIADGHAGPIPETPFLR